MSRLLGVDLGSRRIGLAIADGDGSGARPLRTLRRGRDAAADASALHDIIASHTVSEIVVGLPLEASGAEGPQSVATRAWVADVIAAIGDDVHVTFRDERLTSHVAEARLGPMPRGRSGGPPSRAQRDAYRAKVDREAASIILQDELDHRAGRSSATRHPMEIPT